ncbi:MAG: hypothetical protein E2O40_06730 [Planctomycetota bacterium]|nr:MAG: hypothetical protein E2O40_06730 [Planctomycetota bacterium]
MRTRRFGAVRSDGEPLELLRTERFAFVGDRDVPAARKLAGLRAREQLVERLLLKRRPWSRWGRTQIGRANRRLELLQKECRIDG